MAVRNLIALLLTLSVSNSSFGEESPSPRVTDEEFRELVAILDDGQDMLLGLITGLTAEQWNFKPNADRWSVAECVEHITRTEQAILAMIQQVIAGPRDPEWYSRTNGKLELVRDFVPNRNPGGAGGLNAPLEVRPSEQWDRARAIREFYTAHGALRAYVETMQRDIKDRTFMNPFPAINWMNAHDWLNLAGLHVVRHSKQIIEVQADPSYPKK